MRLNVEIEDYQYQQLIDYLNRCSIFGARGKKTTTSAFIRDAIQAAVSKKNFERLPDEKFFESSWDGFIQIITYRREMIENDNIDSLQQELQDTLSPAAQSIIVDFRKVKYLGTQAFGWLQELFGQQKIYTLLPSGKERPQIQLAQVNHPSLNTYFSKWQQISAPIPQTSTINRLGTQLQEELPISQNCIRCQQNLPEHNCLNYQESEFRRAISLCPNCLEPQKADGKYRINGFDYPYTLISTKTSNMQVIEKVWDHLDRDVKLLSRIGWEKLEDLPDTPWETLLPRVNMFQQLCHRLQSQNFPTLHLPVAIDMDCFGNRCISFVSYQPNGISLDELLDRKSVTLLQHRTEIFLKLVEAFCFLHKLGLIYRNISLKNVYITYDGYIKLVHFHLLQDVHNLARTLITLEKLTEQQSLSYLQYAPPELVAGKLQQGFNPDMWALGVLGYQLFNGSPLTPLHKGNVSATVRAILETDMEPYIEQLQHIPDYIKECLKRCLQTKPKQRISDGIELFSFLTKHG